MLIASKFGAPTASGREHRIYLSVRQRHRPLDAAPEPAEFIPKNLAETHFSELETGKTY